jgi:hypothetical protein
VPSSSHCDQQALFAGEVHRIDDVGGPRSLDNDGGIARVHRVVRHPHRVEARVVAGEDVSPDHGSKLLEGLVADLGLASRERCCARFHFRSPFGSLPSSSLYGALTSRH